MEMKSQGGKRHLAHEEQHCLREQVEKVEEKWKCKRSKRWI